VVPLAAAPEALLPRAAVLVVVVAALLPLWAVAPVAVRRLTFPP
jgi:hypothetical protein